MARISPVTLRGKYVTLEPLSEEHHDGLVEAASDGELWNLWYTSVPRPEGMAPRFGGDWPCRRRAQWCRSPHG